MATKDSLTDLPKVVDVPDQPCQQLYEANPVLLGFDVVNYHQIPSYKDGGVARQGSPDFAFNFEGYQFWFVSDENRKLFVSDPWKYAPAWGGFCSYGMALETQPQWPWQIDFLGPPASPWEGWAIVDGVLIFNIWAAYTDMFLADRETNMELAVRRWKEMFGGELRAGPFNTHCIGHGTMKNWCLTQQPSPWREALPDCSTNIDGTMGGGGGIVSKADSFDDFDAATDLSPYQKKWITTGVLLGLVVGVVLAVLLRRCLRTKQPHPKSLDGDKNNHSDNGNGNAPPTEDTVGKLEEDAEQQFSSEESIVDLSLVLT